jgi:hypothetical protein
MGKYDPLRVFLAAHPGDHIQMTFREIEEVLGAPLPHSKKYPAWWSNSPSNNTMTQAWLDAGFSTAQVDIGSEQLIFRRTRRSSTTGRDEGPGPAADTGVVARLQARLAGTVTFAPGYDPTQPTGEIWDADR